MKWEMKTLHLFNDRRVSALCSDNDKLGGVHRGRSCAVPEVYQMVLDDLTLGSVESPGR